MLPRFLSLLRGQKRDRGKARHYISEANLGSYHELMAPYDEHIQALHTASKSSMVLGTADDSLENAKQVSLPFGEAPAFTLLLGNPGTGKTTLALSRMRHFFNARMPTGGLDFKADLFDGMLLELGAYAYSLPETKREAFVKQTNIINPFSATTLIPFNVCAEIPELSTEIQAYEVTLVFSKLFESGMSANMESCFRALVSLLIESELTIAEAPQILFDETLLTALAQRSTQPDIKSFFLRVYPDLQAVIKTALRSRLESLLLAENLKLMLGANECINLKTVLDDGLPLAGFLERVWAFRKNKSTCLPVLFCNSFLLPDMLPRIKENHTSWRVTSFSTYVAIHILKSAFVMALPASDHTDSFLPH